MSDAPKLTRATAGRDGPADELGELAAEYVLALLAADRLTAEMTITRAVNAAYSTAEIHEQIVAPAMWMIGRLWADGQISVADEHLASEITLRALEIQRRVRRPAGPGPFGRRVLLATPAGERHNIALRMVDELLVEAGYDTIVLGPDVPATALTGAVVRHRPDAVCLGLTLPSATSSLSATIADLRRCRPGIPVIVGGQGIRPNHRIAGIQVCRTASEVISAMALIGRYAA